jgi:L-fucose isomerase-like protein
MDTIKLGMVPAHRGVMDRNFSLDRRARLLRAFSGVSGVQIVAPTEELTPGGLVSGEQDALAAAAMFERERVDGIVLAVLGYGDEKSALAVVERFKGLPVLLLAMKEPVPSGGFLQGASVGGMLPISYGLHKRNIPFTFAGVFDPEDTRLPGELSSFARVCLAVRRFRGARVGMIGFRPYDFEVCIFNEGLLLERYGAKTVPLNLVDLEHQISLLTDGDPQVARIVQEIRSAFSPGCGTAELSKLAKLELVMLRWAAEYRVDALTIQCWSAIQERIGLTPCLTNGRISSLGVPVACEGDTLGALSMLLQKWIADEGGVPWLADILMLHPEEKDLFLAWHCGNAPAGLAAEGSPPRLRGHCSFEEGFAGALATSELTVRPGPVSANRIVEHHGEFRLLHVDGTMVTRDDRMRGSWGWVAVEDRERMLRTVVEEGFVHHVSIVHGGLGPRVREACRYLGMRLVVG